MNQTEYASQTILPLLKDRKIMPSCSLIILALQSCQIMAHGGFFQTTYADKIKKRFINYLKSINETERAENLEKLPVDMALLSLAVQKDKSQNPMKLSEIARMPLEKRKELMDKIPNHPSCQAVVNALPILGKYLDSTAPGYVQNESKQQPEPGLVCRHCKTNQIPSQIQEQKSYARSA